VPDEVEFTNMIERWDPKKKKDASQYTSIKVSPLFGPDIVQLYKDANKKYKPSDPVKSTGAGVTLRALVALDLKFMAGYDCTWTATEEAGPAMHASETARPVLGAGILDDDAPADDPAPPMDPMDFTKWNLLDMPSIPLSDQNFSEEGITARRSYHAALILIFLSDEMERLYPQVSCVLHAAFQSHFQQAFDATDLRRVPSFGASAYTAEEIAWCNSTIDFLEEQLDEEGRAKRGLPPRLRRARIRGGPAAPSAAVLPPAPSQNKKRSPPAVAEVETENDSDTPLSTKRPRKTARKSE
jgi:hypothetical protein